MRRHAGRIPEIVIWVLKMNEKWTYKKAFLAIYLLMLSLIAVDAILVFLKWLRPVDFGLFFLISIIIMSIFSSIADGEKFKKYKKFHGAILCVASVAAFFCMARSFVFRDMVSLGVYHMISISLYLLVFFPAMFLGVWAFMHKEIDLQGAD